MNEKFLSQLVLPGGEEIEDPTGFSQSIGLAELVSFAINLAIVGSFLVSLAFLVYGGIRWITSEGDPERISSARNILIYSIVGLVVVLLSYFVITSLGDWIGVDLIFQEKNPVACDPRNPGC